MLYIAQFRSTLRTRTPDGTTDCIEQTQRATVSVRDDGSWSLRYIDRDNHGQALLQGSPFGLTISRQGDTRSRLPFVPQKRLPCSYQSQQGDLEMHTYTHDYHCRADHRGGSISLRYDLSIGGVLVSCNKLELQWEAQ